MNYISQQQQGQGWVGPRKTQQLIYDCYTTLTFLPRRELSIRLRRTRLVLPRPLPDVFPLVKLFLAPIYGLVGSVIEVRVGALRKEDDELTAQDGKLAYRTLWVGHK